MLLFGREPSLWLMLVGVIVKLFTAFVLPLSIDQQSVVNAVVAALIGVAIAFATRDGQSAAILGFVQAVIALALGFGIHLPPEFQALIMSATATVAAMFVRTQAFAPVPPPNT